VILAKTGDEKKSKLKSIYEDYLYKDIAFLLKNKDFISFEKFLKIIASKV
jgi:predicted AAA+ superfamily ATPase